VALRGAGAESGCGMSELRANGVPRPKARYSEETPCGAGKPASNRTYGEQYWDGSAQQSGPGDCELPQGHEGDHQASWRTGPPGHRESDHVFWD
jgi:hypothetical protein